MTRMLGIHMLETPYLHAAMLEKWQPQACVLLLDILDERLKDRRAPAVDLSIADLEELIDDPRPSGPKYAQWSRQVQIFQDSSDLRDTVVIGRIFIPDDAVKVQIRYSPEQTALFHHNLVLAARARLRKGLQGTNPFSDVREMTINRVRWVIANEVLADGREDLALLARYERRRLELVTQEPAANRCGDP